MFTYFIPGSLLLVLQRCSLPAGGFSKRLAIHTLLGLLVLGLAACAKTQVHSAGMADQRADSAKGAVRAPAGSYWAQAVTGDYAGYASLEQFIELMVRKHGFQRDYLRGLFSQANRKDWTLNYLNKSDKAAKGGPAVGGWTRYRAKFLDDFHITRGIEFKERHLATLQRASRQYGVPQEYILGILAVETKFGGYLGNHRIIDALTTLSFDYARRAEFFRSELEAYLLMSRDEGFDPAEPVGSFAGAMGLGQFMPSSFLRYAVDFNNDGHRDLWNPEDAIGSIANYFAQHGWKAGQPVVSPLKTNGSVTLKPGLARSYTLAEIRQAGLSPHSSYNTDGPVHLLLLRHRSYDQYLLGYPNFYTITRYNNSVYYAMAIHELAQAIESRTTPASQNYLSQKSQ